MFIFALVIGFIFVLALVFSSSNDKKSKSEGNLVLYYAPWCGHCKNFIPTYKKFSDKAKNDYPSLTVEMINCVDNKCPQDIRGYPTVKYIKGDTNVDFKGPRTVDGLNSFVQNN